MGIIEVTIKNWRVFNPKSDKARHPHWFRVNQDLASSESLFDLNPNQKWAWICILGLCCKKDSETVKINTKHLANQSGVKEKEIIQAIEILNKNGTLTVNCQSNVSPLTTHNITVPTDEHNITDNTDRTVQGSEVARIDLVEIWNQFSGKLPKVKECGQSRKDKIRTRLKEHPDPEYWESVIKKCASSQFLTGHNKTGWKVTFDWIIENDSNSTKVFEGAYEGLKSKSEEMRAAFVNGVPA